MKNNNLIKTGADIQVYTSPGCEVILVEIQSVISASEIEKASETEKVGETEGEW